MNCETVSISPTMSGVLRCLGYVILKTTKTPSSQRITKNKKIFARLCVLCAFVVTKRFYLASLKKIGTRGRFRTSIHEAHF